MSCKNCFDNCRETISDKCVKYTGPDIELLGICNGDTLSMIESAIIDKLLTALDGTGITLADVTFANSAWLGTIFGSKNKTLLNLIQLLVDADQTLKNAIDSLTQSAASFNTSCLVDLPANPTRDQILAETISVLCDVKLDVENFEDTYVKIDDLPTLVNNIVNPSSSSVEQYYNRAIPYVAMPYHGMLANFDNTGKGHAGAGYSKIYICNGQNGTPDYRGRSPIGAVKNVPGPALDSVVSPTAPANASGDVNYIQNQKAGEAFHKLTVAEVPSHTHPVTDPGHKHSLPNDTVGGGNSSNSLVDTPGSDEAQSFSVPTGTSQTNISIGSTGGNAYHNTTHPVMVAVFIMYIP